MTLNFSLKLINSCSGCVTNAFTCACSSFAQPLINRGTQVLVWSCSRFSTSNWESFLATVCYWGFCLPSTSTSVSSANRIAFHMSPGPSRCFLAKVRGASVFFLVSGFHLRTLPWTPFLLSLFLIIESWTLTLTEASGACCPLDVVLGSFVTSSMSRHCALGVILAGRPLFITVLSFLCLLITSPTVAHWRPKALEWLYHPFQMIESNHAASSN